MQITLHIPAELESRLKSAAAAKGLEINGYVQRILEESMGASHFGNSPEAREVELIYKINQQSLSTEEWERYQELKQKKIDEVLTENELVEIIRFSEKLEALAVERLGYLKELSELKEMSLDEAMDMLGIQMPSDE